ncbi:putative DNA-binding protein [Caldanaerobacter subterraneus subsp. tengcongensis MB4]|uniref:Uncharacterized protein n=1 Tax=Caldanaerobacter subterraneus subsp. tengcongensis (strain DSM 15242 / JCM 11007 / NBRC 100824 / MB4) TaxID=273068 RepID=Q8R8F4_CALS4|nr:hypothetical protein [Caldanaerobacter subterraneus]AAM25224.1 hypothetical protein TTE2050 [Caldanaerobacter subterraneus subsp. tengcongensis MB4]MBE3579007.1 hypothetical protein [Caldanaerobacter subterraneus]MCS3915179.1 putative DNA-binding protein [Caldanaerobacter subterraneus subsp. tengcongensis MB4]
MNKYTFRVKNSDSEILAALSSLQGKERGDFIREALRFYINNKDMVQQILNSIKEIQEAVKRQSADIAEIKEMIKTQPVVAGLNKNTVLLESDKNNKKKNNEEILRGLVNDFLNM